MDSPEERMHSSPDDIDEPFSFRSADEVLRDDAVDSNAATLEDIANGLSSNGLPRFSIVESHLTSPSFTTPQSSTSSIKKWIEDVVKPVVIALREEGEELRRCRQRAIELEEKKLLRKRQMILMMKRRADRWSPTRRSKKGRVQKGAEQAGRGSAGGASTVIANVATVPMSVRSRPPEVGGREGYSPAVAAAAAIVSTILRRHRKTIVPA